MRGVIECLRYSFRCTLIFSLKLYVVVTVPEPRTRSFRGSSLYC